MTLHAPRSARLALSASVAGAIPYLVHARDAATDGSASFRRVHAVGSTALSGGADSDHVVRIVRATRRACCTNDYVCLCDSFGRLSPRAPGVCAHLFLRCGCSSAAGCNGKYDAARIEHCDPRWSLLSTDVFGGEAGEVSYRGATFCAGWRRTPGARAHHRSRSTDGTRRRPRQWQRFAGRPRARS